MKIKCTRTEYISWVNGQIPLKTCIAIHIHHDHPLKPGLAGCFYGRVTFIHSNVFNKIGKIIFELSLLPGLVLSS